MVTIKRYLREPKRIFVNGQAMDYDEFHSTAASFGFFNFAGICLHRIDQPTIDKLKRITGTTLWTMMNALFKSEDLIRLIESKEVCIYCRK